MTTPKTYLMEVLDDALAADLELLLELHHGHAARHDAADVWARVDSTRRLAGQCSADAPLVLGEADRDHLRHLLREEAELAVRALAEAPGPEAERRVLALDGLAATLPV